VRDYRRIAKSLIYLTKLGVFFNFNGIYLKAFEKFKTRLISFELLKYYDPEFSYRVETNILNNIITGILSQL
jgi:lipoprotein NlpI